MCPEPDLSTGTLVYALLLDKSAIGIYTSEAKAEETWEAFLSKENPVNRLYQIKPFRLDGPAMIYLPY